jgi:GTP cyclohydrolase I
MAVDMEALRLIGKDLLLAIGEDPDRDGLRDTPERFAKWWREFIEYDAGTTDTSFNIQNADQIVVVSGINVWSLCEHHLLPFKCSIAIGYIPVEGKVLGLSKFGRIAHQMAHKPQVQERLANEIADEITRITGSSNIAVIADGEHLCMTMRGIKSPSVMSTSVMRGLFRDEIETRNELLFLVRR